MLPLLRPLLLLLLYLTYLVFHSPFPFSGSGGFSFWSFFGGIVMTLVLIAIGFVGLKYYKIRRGNQGEGNYNRF